MTESSIQRLLRCVLELQHATVFQEIWRIEVSRPEAQCVFIAYVGGRAERATVADADSDDDAKSKLSPVLARMTAVVESEPPSEVVTA